MLYEEKAGKSLLLISYTVSVFPSPSRQSMDLFLRSCNTIRRKYRTLRNNALNLWKSLSGFSTFFFSSTSGNKQNAACQLASFYRSRHPQSTEPPISRKSPFSFCFPYCSTILQCFSVKAPFHDNQWPSASQPMGIHSQIVIVSFLYPSASLNAKSFSCSENTFQLPHILGLKWFLW